MGSNPIFSVIQKAHKVITTKGTDRNIVGVYKVLCILKSKITINKDSNTRTKIDIFEWHHFFW